MDKDKLPNLKQALYLLEVAKEDITNGAKLEAISAINRAVEQLHHLAKE